MVFRSASRLVLIGLAPHVLLARGSRSSLHRSQGEQNQECHGSKEPCRASANRFGRTGRRKVLRC